MGMPKNLNLFHVFIALLCFSRPRLGTAQGNSSSGNNNNPCESYGVCGPFGSCDPEASPICSCLPGFDPRNSQQWHAGNRTGGCRRRVPLACDQAAAANGTALGCWGRSNK
ncbi:unnamed protein product [Cuscuta campestris]|uniref:EGF-like domain-containing protein n=1 Tax=Cuscuta campestris TaxID=132261 RepID=A0A484KRB7_9ASTE|nr:unnamed protein product [Cuscuta campestris]